MGKVIDLDKWIAENELLFDPLIEFDGYLRDTTLNAIRRWRIRPSRKEIEKFQEEYDIINDEINNRGIIDLTTFIYLIQVFDEDTRTPILEYLNKKVDDCIAATYAMEHPILSKLKNIFRQH